MSFYSTWTPAKVQQAADVKATEGPPAFAEYCQQELGVGYATIKDMAILRRKIKEFFEHYPGTDYYTLCRVVAWCKQRKKRFTRVWAIVEAARDAMYSGALPELVGDPVDQDLEGEIERALEREDRPAWRRRLMGAAGQEAREQALKEWRDDVAAASTGP